MPDTKKELTQVSAFLDAQNIFGEEKLHAQYPPEPDFFIGTEEGVIGIEHTTLVKKSCDNGVNPSLHEAEARKIMEKAEEEFYKTSNIKLHVSVSFKNDYGLSVDNPRWLAKSDRELLSSFITDTVLQNIPKDDSHIVIDEYDYAIGKKVLPDKINNIDIQNTNHLNSACWSNASSHMVPHPIHGSNFLEKLKDKNNKPKNYKRDYDKKWLVFCCSSADITTDFKLVDINFKPISSTFDRVFIFKQDDQMIYELTVINSNELS